MTNIENKINFWVCCVGWPFSGSRPRDHPESGGRRPADLRAGTGVRGQTAALSSRWPEAEMPGQCSYDVLAQQRGECPGGHAAAAAEGSSHGEQGHARNPQRPAAAWWAIVSTSHYADRRLQDSGKFRKSWHTHLHTDINVNNIIHV